MNENRIKAIIEKYIKERVIPGATYLIGNEREVEIYGYKGNMQIIPYERKLKRELLYDIASLTKIVITLPLTIKLIQDRKISLSDPISRFFPHTPDEKRDITIFHLLTHTSGYYSYLHELNGITEENVIDKILSQPLQKRPGKEVIYSCINYVTLFYIIKKVEPERPETLANKWFYGPLGMNSTVYTPLKKGIKKKEIVPTIVTGERGMLQGNVHDPLSAHLNGVSGNAGLFSTAMDLYKFATMFLNSGYGIISEELIQKMEKDYTKNLGNSRGLGWQILGKLIGHTGYTGTSLYFSRKEKRVAILLTNRVHPKDLYKEEIQTLRKEFHEEVFKET